MHLQSRQIAGASSGPHLLITGGVHGDEFEPMAAIRRLIRTIDPALLRGQVTLIPIVNQPAFERGHRTADDERDLARSCPGRQDGSVTERIAYALAQHIQAADFYIDLHTGGTRLSVLPLTGYTLHPDAAVLEWQRKMATAFNLPVVWGTDYRLEGRSLSVARDAKVPAIYAEYLGAAVCDPQGIEAYVDGCLNVMAVLDMIDRPIPPSRVQHVVEDDRPSSGHLQICNPSPMDGFFETAVRLGDEVRIGDRLGIVTDALGDTEIEIISGQAGIVLTLRTFPRVSAGDSLVVILETNAKESS